ncbi:MAG: ATP-binding protein [Acidobacteria bacterium]|nr:ATP-binding protein [Acidobacteriota bacterium]
MNRLRNRLIVVFTAATLGPLAVTLWITDALFEHSLRYANTKDLDELSRALERTGREYYQHVRESLKSDAASGKLQPERLSPAAAGEFWQSGETERFVLSGPAGDRLDLLVRRPEGVLVYSRRVGGVGMTRLSEQYARARALVEAASTRDLRRGFSLTFGILAAAAWLAALAVLVYSAHRISGPIQRLTDGLRQLASGNLAVRLASEGDDEAGQAIAAFNRTARELEESRERLVWLTRLESWQALARKMAHEVKNSLTPIRLTMEEVVARRGAGDAAFLEQAAQIVIEEVATLERRVRAFSDLAAEPPVHPTTLDINALVEDRIALLKTANPDCIYTVRLAPERPVARADGDLVKGVLTNLLENAAQAAGAGGVVLTTTLRVEGKVAVEVHDSGPGLNMQTRQTLFEPAISFKKGGMGLGLSIARKSALLMGGDILLVEGELGGAAFRVVLPVSDGKTPDPDR